MPINPQKLEAFANGNKKKDDNNGGKNQPPFGKGGKMGKTGHGYGHGGDQDGEDDHGHNNEDIDVQAIGERVQNGKGDKRLLRLARDVDDESNPPASITDEDIWERAKEAVEPHWDEYDEPYAVTMHVYQAMGGGFTGGGKGRDDEGDADDVSSEAEERYDEMMNPDL